MGFAKGPKPKGDHAWRVYINGEEVQQIGFLQLVSVKYGEVTLGLRPEGYVSWVYCEPKGGGAVTLPFTRMPDGQLLVGLLQENRPNMGAKPVWCVIGGFLTVVSGETHDEAQVREAGEEAGLDSSKAFKLPGLPGNSNRLFFVADPSRDEGIHAYALELAWADRFEKDGETWKLRAASHQRERESMTRM